MRLFDGSPTYGRAEEVMGAALGARRAENAGGEPPWLDADQRDYLARLAA